MGEKTKKQHYVPQCYLKAWEMDGKYQVYVYDKEKRESRINSIEDVASGRYFYDFSQEELSSQFDIETLLGDVDDIGDGTKNQFIEKELSIRVEGPYAEFLTKILKDARNASEWYLKNCHFLHPDSKKNFAELLAIQYMRTAHVRNMIRDISDEVNQFVTEMGASSQTLEEYRTLTKNESKNIHLGMMIQKENVLEIANCFDRLKWVLGINRTGRRLLTSDNPICVVPHCYNGPIPMAGLASRGVEIFITLSPEHILIMRDDNYHKGFSKRDMSYIEIDNQEIIDTYNAFVCILAERNIFSADGDFSLIERIKAEDSSLIQVPKTTLKWGNTIIQSRV